MERADCPKTSFLSYDVLSSELSDLLILTQRWIRLRLPEASHVGSPSGYSLWHSTVNQVARVYRDCGFDARSGNRSQYRCLQYSQCFAAQIAGRARSAAYLYRPLDERRNAASKYQRHRARQHFILLP